MALEALREPLSWGPEWASRIVGGVLGLAVGDALGVPWEFRAKDEVRREFRGVMVGGGTWGQPPGTWSDDTGQTLALIDALARGGGLGDVAWALLEWYRGRYGPVFDVGVTTGEALERLASGVDPRRSGVERPSCGSLMRSYPAAVYTLCRPLDEALEYVHSVGAVTHSHVLSVMATGLYAIVIRGLFAGLSLREAVEAAGEALDTVYSWAPMEARREYAYLREWEAILEEPEEGSCYAPETLRAALWSVATSGSVREALVKAVSLGGDTDTVAAVAGSIAGTIHGPEGIPGDYLESLRLRETVERYARLLARLVEERCRAPREGLGTG